MADINANITTINSGISTDLNFRETSHVELQMIGRKGDDGKSASEVAVDNGFVGTEQDWLNSLQASSVESYATHYSFPNLGSANMVYIATDENKTYRWDSATSTYYCIGSDYNDIKIIEGGNA